MSKAIYQAMTREELKQHLKTDRNNEEAWEVFFDKLNCETEGKVVIPYTESLEETENSLKKYLENKHNS